MAKKSSGKTSRSGRLNRSLVVVAVVLLVLGLIFGAVLWQQSQGGHFAGPQDEGQQPTRPPAAQAPDCPDVRVFAVGGTHESVEADDPFNPTTTAVPDHPAMLWAVTKPVNDQFNTTPDNKRADAYTIPYNAGFKVMVSNTPNEKTFDESVQEGEDVLVDTLKKTADHCPATQYFLVGYSQGAVIVGDVVSTIGQDDTAVLPAKKILGAVLLSDGRRQPGVGRDEGTKVSGQGLEVVLKDSPVLPLISAFGGFTMQGPRQGGFGRLQNRVYEICGTGDKICDSQPELAQNLTELADLPRQLLGGPSTAVHTSYGTTDYWQSDDGKSAVDWILDKALSLIDAAPRTH